MNLPHFDSFCSRLTQSDLYFGTAAASPVHNGVSDVQFPASSTWGGVANSSVPDIIPWVVTLALPLLAFSSRSSPAKFVLAHFCDFPLNYSYGCFWEVFTHCIFSCRFRVDTGCHTFYPRSISPFWRRRGLGWVKKNRHYSPTADDTPHPCSLGIDATTVTSDFGAVATAWSRNC